MRLLRSSQFLVFLVILDVLILLAAIFVIHHNNSRGSAAESSAVPSGLPGDVVESTDSTIMGPLTLAGSPDGTLVRATRGTCDSRGPRAPQVWVADAALAPLQQVTVPALAEVLGLRVTDDQITIVGTTNNCTERGFISTDKGASWERGPVPEGLFWLDTNTTSTRLHGPGPEQRRNLTCTPVGVATWADGVGAAACAESGAVALGAGSRDATMMSGSDVTAVWRGLGAQGDDFPLMFGSSGGCSARLVQSNSEGTPRAIDCVGQEVAALGLTESGGNLIVQAGTTLKYSTNGGESFRNYPTR